MPIYVYGVTEDVYKDNQLGVLQLNVQFTGRNGVFLIISEINQAQIQQIELNEALYHDEVISHYMLTGTVLPCRFMTIFKGVDEGLLWLKKHRKWLKSQLAKFKDLQEIGLQIKLLNDEGQATTPIEVEISNQKVKNYLNQKIQQYHSLKSSRFTELEKLLQTYIQPLCEDYKTQTSNDNLIWKGLFLIHKDNLAQFKQSLVLIAQTHLAIKYLISGPWAPYHFVNTHLQN